MIREVRFYDEVDDALLKFAVIAARSEGKWVFCRHKERTTLEIPGGHREPGESVDQTAARELREETGIAVSAQDLHPVYVNTWPETAGMGAGSSIYHSFVAFFDPAEQSIRLQEGETVDYKLLPYGAFKQFLLEDRFVDVVRRRFLDCQAGFDRIITAHFN